MGWILGVLMMMMIAVPLCRSLGLSTYPVLPYLLYLLGYVCTVYTVHEVSFSGFDVVADSQLSGIDPQAGPISSFFFLYPRGGSLGGKVGIPLASIPTA